MADDYLVPTKNQRIAILVKLFIGLVVYVALRLSIPLFIAFVAAKPTCEQTVWWRLFLIFVLFVGLAIMCRFIYFAFIFLKHDQIPPPGATVFFRTKIVRGWRVKLHATTSLVAALVVLLGLIYLAQTDSVVAIFTLHCTGA